MQMGEVADVIDEHGAASAARLGPARPFVERPSIELAVASCTMMLLVHRDVDGGTSSAARRA